MGPPTRRPICAPIRLSDNVAFVVLESSADYGRDASGHLTRNEELYRGGSGWSGFAPAVVKGGATASGADGGRAFALFTFVAKLDVDKTAHFAMHPECRVAVPGRLSVLILALAQVPEHNRRARLVVALAVGLEPAVGNGTALPVPPVGWLPQLDETVVADIVPGVDGQSCVTALHGLVLTWG